MQVIFQNFVVLIVMALGAVGFHRLWMFMTERGAIFGFVDSWIGKLVDYECRTNQIWLVQFIHKSLGSCPTCNRQRFCEILFFLFVCTTFGEFRWWIYIFFFLVFNGFAIYLDAFYSFMIKKLSKPKNFLKTKKQS